MASKRRAPPVYVRSGAAPLGASRVVDPFAEPPPPPPTTFADLPPDALAITLGELDCRDLARAAPASRAVHDVATQRYHAACAPAALDLATRTTAARFTVALLLNVVRRSLTLISEWLSPTEAPPTIDTLAWTKLTVDVSFHAGGAPVALISVGEQLSVGGDQLFAAEILDGDGNAPRFDRLASTPSYVAWLDALDGGVSDVGVRVARALLRVLMTAPDPRVVLRYPPWWALALRTPTPIAIAANMDPAIAAWMIAVGDVAANRERADAVAALMPPLAFATFYALSPADGVVGVELSNQAAMATKLLLRSSSRTPVQTMQSSMRTVLTAVQPPWGHLLFSVDDWLKTLSDLIVAMNGAEPEYARFNGATLMRAIAADALPARITAWRRAAANRAASLDAYLDAMEAANGTAQTRLLGDALYAAFARARIDPIARTAEPAMSARDARALAALLPALELRAGDADVDRMLAAQRERTTPPEGAAYPLGSTRQGRVYAGRRRRHS